MKKELLKISNKQVLCDSYMIIRDGYTNMVTFRILVEKMALDV